MKNFLRALRCSWSYRGRLLLSLLCALFAAMLWGLTFAAITPGLNLLEKKQNVQEWSAEKVEETEKRIEKLQAENVGPAKEWDEIQAQPTSQVRDKRARDLTRQIIGLESDLRSARMELYAYQVIKLYANKYLPTNCFRTFIW